jgi:hypothetical protein
MERMRHELLEMAVKVKYSVVISLLFYVFDVVE